MTTKARILTIRLLNKKKQKSDLIKKLGIDVQLSKKDAKTKKYK